MTELPPLDEGTIVTHVGVPDVLLQTISCVDLDGRCRVVLYRVETNELRFWSDRLQAVRFHLYLVM